MVEKISVEIGLDGGEEVNRQLADIGKTGEKAFSDIQSAADQVNLDSTTSQFDDLGNTGQAAFQKIASAAQNAAALDNIIQGVKKVEGAFESLGTAVTRMATRMTKSLGLFGVLARSFGPVGIAAGVAAGAILKFGDDSAKALANINVEAAKLDLTAQKFDTLQKALAQLGVDPSSITGGLQKLKESLSGDFFSVELITGLKRFIAELESMPDGVARTQLAIQRLGEDLGGQLIAGLQTGAISAANFAAALGSVTPATQQQIVEAVRYQQTLNLLGAAWRDLKLAFAPIVTPILSFLAQEVRDLARDIRNLIADVKALWGFLNALGSVFTAQGPEEQRAALLRVIEAYKQLGQGAQQTGQQIDQQSAVLNNVTSATTNLTSATTQAANAYDLLGRSLDEATQKYDIFGRQVEKSIAERVVPEKVVPEKIRMPGFASGGLIGGRGTGTSDSNLSWVSRGEHIMPARAVAQPGVLSFLEALRRSGGNLSRALNGMSRFALGGLVPRAMTIPAYAAGGLAGGNNVTINFPGLPEIGGLRASSSAVDELRKAAALAQVRSGGRKPSRYS